MSKLPLYMLTNLMWMQKNLKEQRNIGYEGSRVADISVMATDYSPVLKWLSYRTSLDAFAGMDEETDEESEIYEDDEIQDWWHLPSSGSYIRLNETGMIVHVKGKKAFLLLNRKLTVTSVSNNGQLYPWFDHKIKRIYILSSLVCGSIQGNKQVTCKEDFMF